MEILRINRRTAADKVLCDKAINIAKDLGVLKMKIFLIKN